MGRERSGNTNIFVRARNLGVGVCVTPDGLDLGRDLVAPDTPILPEPASLRTPYLLRNQGAGTNQPLPGHSRATPGPAPGHPRATPGRLFAGTFAVYLRAQLLLICGYIFC